jgi:hypothetical protein
MSKSPDSLARAAAMTKSEAKPAIAAVNELFGKSPDGLREIVRAVMEEVLEAEGARGLERRGTLLPRLLGLRHLRHQQAPRRLRRGAPLPNPSPTSSSTPVMRRCGKAAW